MNRIRSEIEGGAWCPDRPIGINSYEYLQIEFRQLFYVNAVETQGRFGNGQGKEYAEFYQIQYQRDNQSSDWITYRNPVTNKTVRIIFSPPPFWIENGFFFLDFTRQCQYLFSGKTFIVISNLS